MRSSRIFGLILAAFGAALSAGPAVRVASADVARDIVQALRERDDRERALLLERAVGAAATADDADAILRRLLPKARNAVDTEIGVYALSRLESLEALTRIAETAGNRRDVGRRLEAIEALGRSNAGVAAADLLHPLQFDEDARVRTATVVALGQQGALDDAVVVAQALDDEDWRVRSAAIWALARNGWSPPDQGARAFDPVPLLIRRMQQEQGRLIDDCAEALAGMLGERYGARADAYERLWARRTGRTLEQPEATETPVPTLQGPLFTTRSKRLLFVLSVGDSMKQEISPPHLTGAAADLLVLAGEDLVEAHAEAKTKLDLARVHVAAMIRGLADGTRFDVAVYADSPTFAFGELVPADDRTRKRAEARVASLSPGGGANLSEMLRRAFDPRGKAPATAEGGPDTVVLVTDGRLAAPGLTDRNQVLMAVRRWNRVRQIRFIVVGVTPSDDAVLGPLGGGPPRGMDIRIP